MSNKQKVILGVLAVLILVAGGVLAYLKISGNSDDSGNQDQNQQANNNSNNEVNGAPGRVTDTPAFFPTLSFNGQDLWYFTSDGEMIRLILENGVKQKYVLPYEIQLINVIWPARGDNFIAEVVSGSTKKFLYYNAATKSFTEYSPNVKYANFMPDGSHVAYNWVDEKGVSTISVANFDTSGFKKAADMAEPNLFVTASSSGKGLFAYSPVNSGNHNLYYISLEAGVKPITIKTSQTNAAVWSPDGKNFVFNKFDPAASGPNSKLWVGNIIETSAGDVPTGLSAPLSKVVFDNAGKYLYVAVPQTEGDELWRFDVLTGEKKQLYKPSDFKVKTTFSNMIVAPDGKWLYYINSDQFVYGLSLDR